MENELKILMLEDDPHDAELIQSLLKRHGLEFHATVVSDEASFLSALASNTYDVLLADNSLPQYSSTAALKIVRDRWVNLPFILVTGTVSEEFAANIIQQGADDYILKSNLKRLPTAIQQAVERRRMMRARQQAEDSLRLSELRYRTLVEQASDGIIVSDYQGKILEVNTYACVMLGYSRDALSRLKMTDIFFPDDIDVSQLRYEEAMRGHTLINERKMKRRDGSAIIVETSSKMLPDGRFQAIIRDITERKKYEEDLKFSRFQLRHLAAHLQTVREEERAGISREIHDELGQTLTGLKMEITWIGKRMEQKDDAVSEKIHRMINEIDNTIKTVRRLSAELRPGILDDMGLTAALEWYAQEFEKKSGITVHFRELQHAEPDKTQTTGLFRIFQELMTNIARHADARTVNCALSVSGENFVLEVEDDGRGFNTEQKKDRITLGILGMKERALAMNGLFHIDSAEGKGTRVRVEVPFQSSTSALAM
jgi:two-component system, NarL family, sensor histidine kinase UhpB